MLLGFTELLPDGAVLGTTFSAGITKCPIAFYGMYDIPEAMLGERLECYPA
jgi:hypothetical protein